MFERFPVADLSRHVLLECGLHDPEVHPRRSEFRSVKKIDCIILHHTFLHAMDHRNKGFLNVVLAFRGTFNIECSFYDVVLVRLCVCD